MSQPNQPDDPSRRAALVLACSGAALAWPLSGHVHAQRADPVEVALGGFAFAGDAASLEARFPLSRRYERSRAAAGQPIYQQFMRASAQEPGQIRLSGGIAELKGRDQAVAVALIVGAEISSVEQLGSLYKLFTLIKAQVVFFDFKSMTILRAYPISFGDIHALDHAPSADDIYAGMVRVYEGVAPKPGILERFSSTVRQARLPGESSRLIQVTQAQIDAPALAALPSYLTADAAVAQTWLADIVSEALSTRAGIPVVPFAKGYAIGNVMSLRVSDGTVYQLKLPRPDYEIAAQLKNLRRVVFGQAAAGTSYIYGSLAKLKIHEPLLGKVFLDSEFKNGETKRVPAGQEVIDDFPAFYDSLNGLFVKLAMALDGQGQDWVKTAASANDIDRQLTATKELVKLCK